MRVRYGQTPLRILVRGWNQKDHPRLKRDQPVLRARDPPRIETHAEFCDETFALLRFSEGIAFEVDVRGMNNLDTAAHVCSFRKTLDSGLRAPDFFAGE